MRVSVIVPSYRASGTIARSLESLAAQRTSVPHEVVVVDSSDDGTAGIVARDFPWVRLLTSDERLHPGAARNRGVAASRGEILALLDADTEAEPDWIERVVEAHRIHPAPVLGSCVDNANPESWAGWAYYLSAFSRWMPESGRGSRPPLSEARPVEDLPGNGMSVARWAFERHGPFLEEGLCTDTLFCWRVRSAGHEILLLPGLHVRHLNPSEVGAVLARRVRHGRIFARRRVQELRWPPTRTALHLLTSPLLPPVLLWRRGRDVVRAGRYRKAFLLALPLVAAAVSAWSFGEAVGYARELLHRSADEES